MRILAWLTILTATLLLSFVWLASFSDGNLDKSDTVPLILFTSGHGIAILFAVCYLWTTRKQLKEDRARELYEDNETLPSSEERKLKGVMAKHGSIYRFLGLAAFILGPSWFLFMASTGRSWFVGMLIGLPLALTGYITIRLVDVEDERKGAVIRAVRLAYCELRTWPLWVQHGLLSFALTVTMFYCGEIAGQFLPILNFLTAGAIAPLFLLNLLPPINFNPGIPILIVVALVVPSAIWFLFGVLLGRVNECIGGKLWVYIIVWLTVYTILSEAMVLPPSFYDKILDYFAILDSQGSVVFVE